MFITCGDISKSVQTAQANICMPKIELLGCWSDAYQQKPRRMLKTCLQAISVLNTAAWLQAMFKSHHFKMYTRGVSCELKICFLFSRWSIFSLEAEDKHSQLINTPFKKLASVFTPSGQELKEISRDIIFIEVWSLLYNKKIIPKHMLPVSSIAENRRHEETTDRDNRETSLV